MIWLDLRCLIRYLRRQSVSICALSVAIRPAFTCVLFSLAYWGSLCAFLSSANFSFQNQLLKKNILGIPYECQIVWVQTVCTYHQQTTLLDKEKYFHSLYLALISFREASDI